MIFFFLHKRPRHSSCHTTPLQSPCPSPLITNREFRANDSSASSNINSNSQNRYPQHQRSASINEADNHDSLSISSNNSLNLNQQIRSRITSFKNTVLSTPKFYKRKLSTEPQQNPNTSKQSEISSSQKQQHEQQINNSSSNSDSKSWFQRWNFRSDSINGTNSNATSQDVNRDKEFTFAINDRPLNNVKADLIHALIMVSKFCQLITSTIHI